MPPIQMKISPNPACKELDSGGKMFATMAGLVTMAGLIMTRPGFDDRLSAGIPLLVSQW
jgi:hypothetical protein